MGLEKRGGEGRKNTLEEGVRLVLRRWNGLQQAVQNQWGGSDSHQKFHRLASDLTSSLSKSTEPVRLEDLENLLHESMLLTFNTDIEDGSIEQKFPTFKVKRNLREANRVANEVCRMKIYR